MDAPINAVGYIRVSSQEQGESGLGLESQRRSIVAYCTARGMNLLRIYEDVMTASEFDRPALTALRNDVVKAKGTTAAINCFVVMKFDRLSRVAFDMLYAVREFKSHGVEFVSVLEGVDATTPMGKAMLTVIAAFAELERDEISARTKRALKVRTENGQRNSRAPYGFRPVLDGGLMPYPPEIEMLDAIWRLRYIERYSYDAIVRHLHEVGVEVDREFVRSRLRRNRQCLPFLSLEVQEAAKRAGIVAAPLPADSVDTYDPTVPLATKNPA